MALAATGAWAIAVPGPAAAAASPARAVVVLQQAGAGDAPERAVERAGGDVGRQLPIVGGFAARVPASSVDALRRADGVRAVHADRRFAALTDEAAAPTTGTELAEVREALGAASAGTGEGVDVALVDTGVSPVPGLDGGQIVDGPDFSSHADDPAHRHLDAFGHGTHLAGVIAANAPEQGLVGVAPGARVVNVKVADHQGATSLSQLLAGIDWVVRHRQTGDLRIRVLALAFGAPSAGSYRDDPLAFAVEQAWRRGIAVVVAGGNGGAESGALDSPAYDPYVVAVGAQDTLDTVDPADDAVADFSSHGTAERTPDVLAPGVGIVSLRVPGSFLDDAFPHGRVGASAFRGSGTSQSAAAAAAGVALLLERRPELDPDGVKAVLRATARPLAGVDPRAQGTGVMDVGAASAAAAPAHAPQRWPGARGGGPWRAHGDVALQLAVEHPSATRWSATRWSATRWSATRWSATRWSATRWSATRWSATRWSATRWSATRWSATRWSGVGWEGGTP